MLVKCETGCFPVTPESPTQNPYNRTLSPARRDELAKIRQRQLANAVHYIWETGEDKFAFRYFHTGFWESCEKHNDGESPSPAASETSIRFQPRSSLFVDFQLFSRREMPQFYRFNAWWNSGWAASQSCAAFQHGHTVRARGSHLFLDVAGVLWLSVVSEFTYIGLLGMGFLLMWLEVLCSHREMHALKINAYAAICTVLSGESSPASAASPDLHSSALTNCHVSDRTTGNGRPYDVHHRVPDDGHRGPQRLEASVLGLRLVVRVRRSSKTHCLTVQWP